MAPKAIWRKNVIKGRLGYLGWTAGDLAERVGVSRQSISDAMNARVEAGLGLTLLVAEALDVTVQEMTEPGEVGPKKGGGQHRTQPAPGMALAGNSAA